MRARRLIVIVLATVGFATAALSFPYFYSLRNSSPRSPLAATQQVYQLSDHGYLFYITRREYWLHCVMLYGGGALFAVAAVLNHRWKVIHNLTLRGWELPK